MADVFILRSYNIRIKTCCTHIFPGFHLLVSSRAVLSSFPGLCPLTTLCLFCGSHGWIIARGISSRRQHSELDETDRLARSC